MVNDPCRIRVIEPGWCTTVQDRGRRGFQHYGVPESGAMDRRALVVANRLVGNCDDDAGLEITVTGPELFLEHETVLAITGADLTPSVNGITVPLWTSLLVKKDSRLTFGARRAGGRCYLAVAGGIDAPIRWGSRSTHLASRNGGIEGRPLKAGDCLLSPGPAPGHAATIGRTLPRALRPVYRGVAELRLIMGPQDTTFTAEALRDLVAVPYKVSSQSDRMGYRLEGQALRLAHEDRGITDATALGALQVPPDGQPILLMADRQTTGGYPKIACVISADLHVAAQLLPGDTVRFRRTTLPDAAALWKAQWRELDAALPPVS